MVTDEGDGEQTTIVPIVVEDIKSATVLKFDIPVHDDPLDDDVDGIYDIDYSSVLAYI